jgi:sporulation protein YlmC with PRC-barrel domain
MTTKSIAAGAIAAVLMASTAMAQAPGPTTRTEATSASVNHAYKGQWRLNKTIGLDVYNQSNEKLGDISELLLDQSGKIQTAILGVGGFLGVGERLVAVNFDQLTFVDHPIEQKVGSTTQAPSTSTKNANLSTQTTTGTATVRSARSADEKWYPDHAIVNITADQLKAMNQFKYN